ncbi:Pyridoxine/pyridoxamine 5'-phosphate oxidase [Arsenophonus endosymbiont of Aleurodicus dispersus]|uniref:pyridoxamine 5'-phosphate oxidase n=1 Tax=Arsenophonus endosymbiont of Aleurodicus dispersus TaxID=235559 RepID=UPI000EB4B144|nr:pyridoxamine 5'-phosphate oxidase [Arsenophonus endosymbiont of Aleurodicus dispersus]VAY02282.1 Pyridoxine/pyridoxamine 5'-phosphate oxidase [Arsenophonus endosymbiont of Aleurodicus dispersus]
MAEKIKLDIANLRREYTQGGLRRKDLTDQPLVLFDRWLKQAYEAKIADPTAMCVATVDNYVQPYQRIVLLKHYDKNELIFYTNLSSRKAQHIDHNNKVSLLFPWYQLDRQVCFLGEAEKLSSLEVIKYFHSRPKDSQIVAWVSKQSTKISARSILEHKFLQQKQKFKNREIPLPSFWGGYRVRFHSVEFWQGGTKRLHDRFLYQWQYDHWHIDRLAP